MICLHVEISITRPYSCINRGGIFCYTYYNFKDMIECEFLQCKNSAVTLRRIPLFLVKQNNNWKQSQIDNNDNTHCNSVVEKYFITRHYNLHKMPVYSNQLVSRYQSGTDVQSTFVKTKKFIFYEQWSIFYHSVYCIDKDRHGINFNE